MIPQDIIGLRSIGYNIEQNIRNPSVYPASQVLYASMVPSEQKSSDMSGELFWVAVGHQNIQSPMNPCVLRGSRR